MNAEHSMDNSKRLTDEELARLLDKDLDPDERARLAERLELDPEGATILALASTEKPSLAKGFSEKTVNSLLEKVKESSAVIDICPYCAGDLFPGGIYCPHCAGQVIGNPLTCLQCGSPVREDSIYCPKCGNFFRQSVAPVRKDPILSPLLLLGLGVISIIVAIIFEPVRLLFFAISCVSLGAWLGEIWLRKRLLKNISLRNETNACGTEEKGSEGRKTG
jgi:hypothetical protein